MAHALRKTAASNKPTQVIIASEARGLWSVKVAHPEHAVRTLSGVNWAYSASVGSFVLCGTRVARRTLDRVLMREVYTTTFSDRISLLLRRRGSLAMTVTSLAVAVPVALFHELLGLITRAGRRRVTAHLRHSVVHLQVHHRHRV